MVELVLYLLHEKIFVFLGFKELVILTLIILCGILVVVQSFLLELFRRVKSIHEFIILSLDLTLRFCLLSALTILSLCCLAVTLACGALLLVKEK